MRLEHGGFPVESQRRLLDDGGVGSAHREEGLDEALEQQRSAGARRPMLEMPALPAHDVGSRPRIVRPKRVGPSAREVLHDRGRLPEDEVAVDEGRRASCGIEREMGRRALLALAKIDEHVLEVEAEMRRDGAHLPGVRRTGEAVEFHAVCSV
jgi:hypothetical protein